MNDQIQFQQQGSQEKLHFIDRLLRHRRALYQQVGEGKGLSEIFLWSLLIALVGIAAFGIAIASAPENYQFIHFLRLAGKTLIIFFAAMGICFPTFYVFSSIAGSTLNIKQVIVVLMMTLSLTGLLLVGTVSIIVFFSLVTEGSFQFLGGLNVVIGFLASILSFVFMIQGIDRILRQHGKKDTGGIIVILILWFMVYAAVLIQLITELRPFFDVSIW